MKSVTYRDNPRLWEHTETRIINAEKSAKNYNDFVKKMVTRLNRITKEEKIHFAIAVLKDRNHHSLVDIYEGRLIMDKFLKQQNNF